MADAVIKTWELNSKRQKLENMRVELIVERSSFLAHWRDVGDNISPTRQRYFTSQTDKGNRRNQKIMDGTASLAARTLSSGMMGGVTNPAREWFKLGVKDPKLTAVAGVRSWLDEMTNLMRITFNDSNLYQALPAFYNDLGVFGTAAMMAEEDFDNVIRFYTFPIGSYMIANDAKLKVSTFFREFRMTVRQIVEKFQAEKGNWDNFSDRVKTAWEEGRRETWIDVCHAIYPNEDYDSKKINSKYKKYSSCYWEAANIGQNMTLISNTPEDNTKFLRESGYDKFPVMVGRWSLASEDVYGTDCPGMMALGDVKQLQLGEKRIMQAIEKVVNPPMKGPESMANKPASILPGAFNYTDEGNGRGKFEPAHQIDPRLAEMENKQQQKRQLIDKAFFVDLFLMISNDARTQPPTAEEIIEKRSEKMLVLGPVLQQLDQDVLSPLIEICYDYLHRQGWIHDDEVPAELAGKPLQIDYISIMAQAQKILGVSNIERFTNFVVNTSTNSQRPELLDVVAVDDMILGYADALGMPQKFVNSKEIIQKIRGARAQQQAAAQQTQMAEQAASAAKQLSQADMTKDSALKRLTTSGVPAGTGVPAAA